MFELLAFAAAVAAPNVAAAPRFEPRACPAPLATSVARCGVVRVPENRSRPRGRMIDLNVVILPSVAAVPDLPPLVDIDGGPGLPSTRSAGFYLTDGAGYRARREIVLVDQRGTGASNPLSCPELAAPREAYAEMYPPAAVARCRRDLERKADLTLYTTREAVEDLDAVRAALGHDRLDLVALSYGTTMALRYMATYPARVRAAVLISAAPPDAMPPRHHATAAGRALDLLLEECAGDASCHAAFPAPGADLKRAMKILDAQPAGLSSQIFVEKLRTLMYRPDTARSIPYLINRAAAADWKPFYEATREDAPSPSADGVYLSITCAESFAMMDYSEAAATARGTIFGDYRLRRQHDACRAWPAGRVSRKHLSPVVFAGPVLLVSGRLDPVTPPDWAARAARRMPNSRQLIMPHSGHVFEGLSGIDTCYDPLVIAFLESGNAAGLDAACLDEMKPPPFKLKADGP